MVDNLRRKYKFTQSQGESTFDHQFLNISPFFNSLAVKKDNPTKAETLLMDSMREFEEEEDE
jgi:hypothetical protein